MKLDIVFNDQVINNEYSRGWGFSCLADKRVLFDTGPGHEPLFSNMAYMNISIPDIESIVISHDHDDHTGGLWRLLDIRKGIKVYVCRGVSKALKDRINSSGARLIENKGFSEISKDVFVTEELTGIYKNKDMHEQALAVRTQNGISLITGCAHPGIIEVLGSANKRFKQEKLYLALGGFHLKNLDEPSIREVISAFRHKKVQKAAPAHCTGDIAEEIFRQEFKRDFIAVKSGQSIEV